MIDTVIVLGAFALLRYRDSPPTTNRYLPQKLQELIENTILSREAIKFLTDSEKRLLLTDQNRKN